MSASDIENYFDRIDKLKANTKPKFGKMNVNQMVCHCTDQIRLALNTIKAEEYGGLTSKEVMLLANKGKTVPVAKGLGQVEGGGTQPTNLENDIVLLKQHILEFFELEKDFNFGAHPYFGKLNKEKWTRITNYHLNHHLSQFNV
jgi:hypothetical protein